MRKLLYLCLLLPVLALLSGSCGSDGPAADRVLSLADSLMFVRPDSSLLLLESLPSPQKLGQERRARYALLLTQARYKNYLPLEDDSLISLAIDHFGRTGDAERLAYSHFYAGCVYREQEKLPDAVTSYLKSLRLLPPEGDSLFLSMVYSHLGDCYGEQYLNAYAIDAYKSAYAFCGADRADRALYPLLKIGDNYLIQAKTDSAFSYYQQVEARADSLQMSDWKATIYKNIAAFWIEKQYYDRANDYLSKALLCLEEDETFHLTCYLKAEVMNHLNRADSVLYYLNLAKHSPDMGVKTSVYNELFSLNKQLARWEDAALYADSFIIFYDSIQGMNDRAEIDSLLDNHRLELHKYQLAEKQKRIAACLIAGFLLSVLLLILLFLWRDRRRKNIYIALQKQLADNRSEALLLNVKDLHEEEKESRRDKLKEESYFICLSLFKSTEGYKKLAELQKASPKERINIAGKHRSLILKDIKSSFVDVLEDLSVRCPSLTAGDLLFCALALLHCPKEVVMDLMAATSDALKTRKNRIKNKMGKELFDSVFHIDNL